MDRWEFRRGEGEEAVTARGWLLVSNAHREIVISRVLAGEGEVRALADWGSTEVPPVNLLYRASVCRIPRVRLFIEFVTELFLELETLRGAPLFASRRPEWLRRHCGRSSAMLARGR